MDESLYHATLPMEGENHVGHLGPVYWNRTRGKGYLVLTSHRLIFVRAPSLGRRSYDPQHEIWLEQVERLSSHEGKVTTVFTVNGEPFTALHLASAIKSYTVTGFRDLVARTREQRLGVVRAEASRANALKATAQVEQAKLPPPPPSPPVQREREVIREIVKIPCPYCGGLISLTDTRCALCGAPLKHRGEA